MKKYNLTGAESALRRKKGLTFNGQLIEVKRMQTDIGNKSWGKIDYLCKNGYRQVFTGASEIADDPKPYKKKKAITRRLSDEDKYEHSNADLLDKASKSDKHVTSESHMLKQSIEMASTFRPNFNVKVDKVMIVNKKEADRIFAENQRNR